MKKLAINGLSWAVLALSLTACTSMVSEDINDEGVAAKVIFPTPDSAWNPEGIFPNADNVRTIAPGVTKDDLYYLLGRPHFKEMHGAREWDYIFKFRGQAGEPISTCQYKVIFDKDMRGQSFHWQPETCKARFYHDLAHLDFDALFPFNRSGTGDINAKGKALLNELAATVKQHYPRAKLHIVGHADYIGSEDYNQGLSERRAQSVKTYLVQKGIAEQQMVIIGKGENEPVVQCQATGSRAQLIDCLAPNRRVHIVAAPH
ncbi:MAG: flagellar motor protein MotB [Gammaproteobacteria bacterium]|nr:MAG: flagellar motor protein MotB [Gammaproteobacteria bacterium]